MTDIAEADQVASLATKIVTAHRNLTQATLDLHTLIKLDTDYTTAATGLAGWLGQDTNFPPVGAVMDVYKAKTYTP